MSTLGSEYRCTSPSAAGLIRTHPISGKHARSHHLRAVHVRVSPGNQAVFWGVNALITETDDARRTKAMHTGFLRDEVRLLLADDASRTTDAQPRDGFTCGQALVLHNVQSDQRAGAPESCKAVHSHEALRLLANLQESVHDLVVRRGAVGEGQLVVRNACACKGLRAVGLAFVESINAPDVLRLEDLQVVFGSQKMSKKANHWLQLRRHTGRGTR